MCDIGRQGWVLPFAVLLWRCAGSSYMNQDKKECRLQMLHLQVRPGLARWVIVCPAVVQRWVWISSTLASKSVGDVGRC